MATSVHESLGSGPEDQIFRVISANQEVSVIAVVATRVVAEAEHHPSADTSWSVAQYQPHHVFSLVIQFNTMPLDCFPNQNSCPASSSTSVSAFYLISHR